MSNEETIKLMLKISNRIRPYKYTAGQLTTFYSEIERILPDEKELMEQLKKSIEKLKYKIKLGNSNIFDLYRKLEGYSDEFVVVDYISTGDLEDGYILVDSSNEVYLALS